MDQPVERLKSNLVYEGEATAKELQNDLVGLRGLDKVSERKKRLGCFVAVIGGFTAFIGSLLVAQETGGWGPPGIGLITVGVLVLAGGIWRRVAAGRHDLPDTRYELLHHVVEMVRRDMAADGAVRVRLDFTSPTASGKLTGKDKVGLWDVKFYQDPWLTLQGRFLDGTSYLLQVCELTQHRSRWKTSASGKSKHKSKTKTATVATLNLKVKPNKYPQLGTFASDAVKKVPLPGWCQLKRLQVGDTSMSLKIGAKVPWRIASPTKKLKESENDGAQMIAMMFLGLYEILGQARLLKK